MSRKSRRPALESVLVPSDFSPGARRAMERAARLPIDSEGRIHLIHVLPRGTSVSVQRQATARLSREWARVERHARTAGFQPAPATTRSVIGEPYVEIIRQARTEEVDLLVLGRRGSGGSFKSALGSTAARVARMSDAPVLLVDKKPDRSYRRPLVAFALDPSMRRLLELVLRVCDNRVKTINAVHAYRVPFTGFVSAGTEARPSLHHQQCRDAAAAGLAAQLQLLRGYGLRVNAVLRRGDARSVVLHEAEQTRADLVAMGTHGRSGIAHALVGSVAESVMTFARQDVLVARPVRFTFEGP